MCGIIGIVQQNKNKQLVEKLFQSLKRLEYRGYDSVGFAIINNNRVEVGKDKGTVDEVISKISFEEIESNIGIGHSRWATHGPPSKNNAHPHTDCTGKIAVIHNGIISNFLQLRKELTEKGHVFKSETDTEVIPHLLEEELKKGKTIKEALFNIGKILGGAYAVVVLFADEPNRLYAMKKENPLIIGVDEEATYAASDIPAFLPYTREVVTIKDDELVILSPGKYEIYDVKTKKKIERKPHTITWTPDAAQKGGYPHFMLKEIHESGNALRTQLKANSLESMQNAIELINNAKKIFVVAAGSAYYAGLTAYYLFTSKLKKIVIPVIASEYENAIPLIDNNSLVIAVSQSGETIDTIKAVKAAKKKGAKILSVVNVVGSSITRISDEIIYIHAGPEIGVAATKTFLAQAYAIWRLYYAISKKDSKKYSISEEEIEKLGMAIESMPNEIEAIITKYEAKAKEVANKIKNKASAFYLGRGLNVVTALEGALKLKEISYIHAEAYPAGESKHGPIALIEEDYPVVVIAPNDNTREKIIGNIMEMKARGATIIAITEEGDEEIKQITNYTFEINKQYSHYLQNIAYQIPLHLIAYYTATLKGYNPDYPRNLAKSVTVE